ncbi:phosphate butyryltransferase [Sediminibacillus albus]|uniref:Phosphate butyryltransferase n=1 Tax=Sediminibacillus albus TaxID=407036 RepID=A0A1G8VG95_9BACI|nr:phosphate butyryltransferase [Sediminibacillus albus]SDJ65073.1 phosphate butyryltransferase [Sediminibacillus albus]
MKKLEELLKNMGEVHRKNIAVVQAADKEVLMAVEDALRRELCQFTLYGSAAKIKSICEAEGIDPALPDLHIVDAVSEEEAASKAVKDVANGTAHVLMKGNIATSSLMKEVLNKQYGLRTGNILSHTALFEIPGHKKTIFLTDAALNIAPDLQQKASIINNAVHVAKSVGIAIPKVAVLAAVETVNPAMQTTLDAAVLAQMQKRGQISGCVVDGPLAFDVAVSPKAADHKRVSSEVAGDTDILVVPSIETGNALYKSFVYFSNAKVAAVITGAKAPIVLTSRSDTAENKLTSLALALRTLL